MSQPLMRPCLIEIRHIGFRDAAELALTQDEKMIQTLPANTAQKPFADRVGIGSFDRGSEDSDPRRAGYLFAPRKKCLPSVKYIAERHMQRR